jgi:DNA-binding MarR family transcriptional regulator
VSDGADSDLRLGLHRLQRLLSSRRVFSNVAAAAGVDLSQQCAEVLTALGDDGPRPVADVARQARMDVAAVSRQLHTLEARELVRRRPSPNHRSVVLVEATARGKRVARQIDGVRRRHLDDALASWSAEERSAFGARLLQFVDDLQHTPIRDGERAPAAEPPS